MSENQSLREDAVEKIREIKRGYLSVCMFFMFGICAFDIAILTLLGVNDSDCDQPLRLLLWLYAIIGMAAFIGLSLLGLSVANSWALVFKCAIWGISIFGVLSVVLFVVGNVWIFSSEDCSEEFPAGYTMSILILAFYYMTFGLALVCACFAALAYIFRTPTEKLY